MNVIPIGKTKKKWETLVKSVLKSSPCCTTHTIIWTRTHCCSLAQLSCFIIILSWKLILTSAICIVYVWASGMNFDVTDDFNRYFNWFQIQYTAYLHVCFCHIWCPKALEHSMALQGSSRALVILGHFFWIFLLGSEHNTTGLVNPVHEKFHSDFKWACPKRVRYSPFTKRKDQQSVPNLSESLKIPRNMVNMFVLQGGRMGEKTRCGCWNSPYTIFYY